MQLVAYGAQDIYLTGNPQITFFKVVYRRHTNFSMETIEQTLNGAASTGQTSTCTISRNGDLVYRMYVTSTRAAITDGSTTLVNEAELEIGGQKIDKHYSEWMNVWNELSTPESKAVGLKSMIGSLGSTGTSGVGLIQVPLQFWFCRNPGLALPLIALQYHEVKVKVTWGGDADTTCGINCDYIYLDTDERRRFAQVSHEYLIEQLQKEDKSESGTHKLNFNHPVKELIWTTAVGDDYVSANIKLNGHDRFALQETEYFQIRQPYECHTAVPRQNLPSAGKGLTAVGPFGNTTLTVPTGITAQLVSNAAANNAASTFNFVSTTGILNIRGAGTPAIADFAPGQELLLSFLDVAVAKTFVAVVLVQSRVVNGTPGHGAVAGFGANNAHNITMTISVPTEIGGTATMPSTDAANDKITIFKVSSDASVTEQGRTSSLTKKINVYSFALKPEEHQPSGTCNFSRIDNAQLIFSTAKACIVYAVNYNVLRIMSGMGGLAYSN